MNREEIIWCSRWKDLCDYTYEGQDDLPSGVVGCDITAIPDFFNKIKDSPNRYIVISYRSDYGLEYQYRSHPALDIAKWVKFQLNPQKQGYNDLICPARLNKTRCNPTHKFSIKCYAHTECTFNSIPENILHWYCTNNNVEEPKVSSIPFGVHDEPEVISNIELISDVEILPEKALYVNFQFYTHERYNLFANFQNLQTDTFTYTTEREIPHQEYLKQLKRHRYILSPPGNGIDCFRNLEVIYMGSQLLVHSNYSALHYLIKAGAISYEDDNISSVLLAMYFNQNKKFDINLQKISAWSYWRAEVLGKRNSFRL